MPPLATNLDDFKNKITVVMNSLYEHTLKGIRDEFNYCLDVVRAAGGGAHRTVIKWFTANLILVTPFAVFCNCCTFFSIAKLL